MRFIPAIKATILTVSLAFIAIPTLSFASDKQFAPVVSSQIFEKAKKNDNWKIAVATGKDAQVVMMNITPQTNPQNEIGMETHEFDQVIFVVEGKAKAVIDGKESEVSANDMVYIPQGTPHNLINLNADKPFKIISVYSATDIPINAVYKKKSDASND